jgi:hypothetical protein
MILVEFPKSTNINVNMMPILMGETTSIPVELRGYVPLIEKCRFTKGATVYLTIVETLLKRGEFNRRPGIHTDGTQDHVFGGNIRGRYDGETGQFGGDKAPGSFGGPPLPGSFGGSPLPGRFGGDFGGGRFGGDKLPGTFGGSGYPGAFGGSASASANTGGWGGTWGGASGIYLGSNDGACRIWERDVTKDQVDHHRSLLALPVGGCFKAKANHLYHIGDRTPHQSLPAKKEHVRQFFRVVGPDVGVWWAKHSTPNPLGVKPNAYIATHSKFE